MENGRMNEKERRRDRRESKVGGDMWPGDIKINGRMTIERRSWRRESKVGGGHVGAGRELWVPGSFSGRSG